MLRAYVACFIQWGGKSSIRQLVLVIFIFIRRKSNFMEKNKIDAIASLLRRESRSCQHSFGPEIEARTLIQFHPTEQGALRLCAWKRLKKKEIAFSSQSSISLILFCTEQICPEIKAGEMTCPDALLEEYPGYGLGYQLDKMRLACLCCSVWLSVPSFIMMLMIFSYLKLDIKCFSWVME